MKPVTSQQQMREVGKLVKTVNITVVLTVNEDMLQSQSPPLTTVGRTRTPRQTARTCCGGVIRLAPATGDVRHLPTSLSPAPSRHYACRHNGKLWTLKLNVTASIGNRDMCIIIGLTLSVGINTLPGHVCESHVICRPSRAHDVSRSFLSTAPGNYSGDAC